MPRPLLGDRIAPKDGAGHGKKREEIPGDRIVPKERQFYFYFVKKNKMFLLVFYVLCEKSNCFCEFSLYFVRNQTFLLPHSLYTGKNQIDLGALGEEFKERKSRSEELPPPPKQRKVGPRSYLQIKRAV